MSCFVYSIIIKGSKFNIGYEKNVFVLRTTCYHNVLTGKFNNANKIKVKSTCENFVLQSPYFDEFIRYNSLKGFISLCDNT
jgi:hypothetical protein